MRKLFLFVVVLLSIFLFTRSSLAQPAPAADAKAAKGAKAPAPVVEKPMAFWAKTLPTVNGKFEAKYDINGDGLLQTSETKILLRHVSAEILKTNFYNTQDSRLLALYDKSKDGVLSKYELEDIKKDLSY